MLKLNNEEKERLSIFDIRALNYAQSKALKNRPVNVGAYLYKVAKDYSIKNGLRIGDQSSFVDSETSNYQQASSMLSGAPQPQPSASGINFPKREEVTDSVKYTGRLEYISSFRCRELRPEAYQERIATMINQPDFDASINKFISLMGTKFAHDYLARVLNNLKYEVI